MATLEELKRGATVRGVLPDGLVTVVDVRWVGSNTLDLTYKDAQGRVDTELLFRDREPTLQVVTAGSPWTFAADGAMLRLVSEAYRIQLGHLFDPYVAIQSSIIEPLPHQITAVYEEMLRRQPLRFLLADDPGAGKTIMTGLLIKELLLRADLQRCLICCPGNLAEQWQDELGSKFLLEFDIITRQAIEESRTGNPLAEKSRVIVRLDQFSRSEELQEKLRATDWDLIVCDEAHKMSASFSGNELKETRRYKLGRLLGTLTRHFLLLTATPHNGKEEDFQLFMALLDGDRFEGRFRDGVHVSDTSDLMRRLTKEQMYWFDGRRLFPERQAHTVSYELSDEEARLYQLVTDYVREEMNRVERLQKEGEGKRGNTVGFALTVLQRRLASSPEAIYQSLSRRRKRLEARLREARVQKRGLDFGAATLRLMDEEDLDDLDDAPEDEASEFEDTVIDLATAARTIGELEKEIRSLEVLEARARELRNSRRDRKWEQLSALLQDNPEMFDRKGTRRKLIIFTEHKDTLLYLQDRVTGLIGRPDSVVTIRGGMVREERRTVQERFTQDKDVQVLIATDAAGEGINLQRAHLMVNYDLPWNPNRLEQRFGRIHRIGQTEVCHVWNLVAAQTREGAVYQRLLEKLDQERKALGGRVFDVLGNLFEETRLRDLLIEAIRYGERPEVRNRINEAVDHATDREHVRELLETRGLARTTMDARKVQAIREDMERAQARQLQPHFIASFFLEAFRRLGGSIHQREAGRYEISRVPAAMRTRDRAIGHGAALQEKYERVTFEKDLRQVQGKPLAAFICPGHPLLDTAIDLILERYSDLLREGAILVDPADQSEQPRALIYLEDSIQDGRTNPRTERRQVVSRQLHFLEVDASGTFRDVGYAPYLDYRPPSEEEKRALDGELHTPWLTKAIEDRAVDHAAAEIIPRHLEEVRSWKVELVDRTLAAVKDRLEQEIRYWDHRSNQLREQEEAGETPRLNSAKARERADELADRLQQRLGELEKEKHLSARSPVVRGGALVVPQGLLDRLCDSGSADTGRREAADVASRQRVERLAVEAVMAAEKDLGRTPVEMPVNNPGYDIESREPDGGGLLFIEVKGRVAGARTVTVTKNEVLAGLNKGERYILALVEVDGEQAGVPAYLRAPFNKEPDFSVTSINFDLPGLLSRAGPPS